MHPEKQSTHVVWRAGMTFDATTTTGHHLVMDSLPPTGEDRGPKPIELMLSALGGCTAMDVLSILQKMREPVIDLCVDVTGTRATKHPMIYTDIEVVYRVSGNVNPSALERAIELSETKYCGAIAMLAHSAHISTRYEIEPSDVLEQETEYGPDQVVEVEHVASTLP